jgi:hypothetical protein
MGMQTTTESNKTEGATMKTITIKTVKRASGYQARYELPGTAPVRCVGHETREAAVMAAQAGIKRTMDIRVPGMSSIIVKVA